MKVNRLLKQLVCAIVLNLCTNLYAQAPDKPNIVFVMVDDGRYDEYRPTGAPDWYVAPNIERIANEGVNFHQAYAPTPLCGPSRASVYTGLYSHQHGTYNNGDDLNTALPLIQEILHDEGYYTGFIGKYGNGFPAPNEFDYWVDIGDEELYKNTWIKVNGVNVYVPGHITNAFNDYINYFMDSVEVHSDQPFALFFFPLAPHTPNTPRSADAGLYINDTMPFPDNFYPYETLFPSTYTGPQSIWVKDSLATVGFTMDRFACLIGVDDNVSQILNRLDTWGETDSSLILFTSDNGYIRGEHKMRAKAFALEESTHVPMFIRYPAWFPTPDSISDDFVELVDIAKTLLDVAGIPDTFGFQGYSIRDIAAPDTLRPYTFYEYEGADPGAASQVPDLRGVRSLEHLYVYSSCDCWTEEFYDLTIDPEENFNRILQPEYYPLVLQYRSILDSVRIALGDTADYMILSCNLVGAYEVPDGIDNDCDGVVDDSLDAFIRYIDLDGDGYGDPDSSMIIFGELPGFVANALDCADTSAFIHPAAVEICDGIDNDCDGLIDDADGDIVGQQIWYFDNDLDGYGDNATELIACFPPLGYILTGNDCDDADPADTLAYPEVCNTIDDDCDGIIDDADPDVIGMTTWYFDGDGDGFGVDTVTLIACFVTEGYVALNGDCNDSNPLDTIAYPEICNLIDDDCDGIVDDADPDVVGMTTWYFDGDGDGFGVDSVSTVSCFLPEGFVVLNGDCNDSNPSDTIAYPEICNLIDDDCDGLIDDADPDVSGQTIWYADMDNDGVGDYANTTLTCFMPPLYTDNYGDCNDADSTVTHGSPEVCNYIDDDCDGLLDDSDPDVSDRVWYFADADGDGFGDQASAALFCFGAAGYVLDSTDCNDLHSAIFPLAAEICDGLDNNCNGLIDDADSLIIDQTTFYADADGDGYGNSGVIELSCNLPVGFVLNDLDCNDADNSIHPDVIDICDGVNNDCDLVTDEDEISPVVSADGPLVFCKGDNVVFTASPVISGFTFQWYKSGVPVAGATNITYTATASGNYKVRFTAPGGCITESPIQEVTANNNPKPSVTLTSASNDLCVNNPVKLTTKNKLGSTFQWYKGAVALAGATTNKYNATASGNYKVTQVDATGCSGTSKNFSVVQSCRDIAPYDENVTALCAIYPNPNEGIFTLEAQFATDLQGQAIIRIFSMVGQLVHEQYVAAVDGYVADDIHLTERISSGVYIVDVALGQYRVQREMIVE